MLSWFTTIFDVIGKFADQPTNKQLIYLMGLLLFGFISLTLYFYNKHEAEFKRLKEENNSLDNQITSLKLTQDSLYRVIYDIKVEELNKDLRTADSLLRESERIKKSMSPVIKQLNNKIDEINNP
jgi:uncharacterized protein YdcH (DUF465 family)